MNTDYSEDIQMVLDMLAEDGLQCVWQTYTKGYVDQAKPWLGFRSFPANHTVSVCLVSGESIKSFVQAWDIDSAKKSVFCIMGNHDFEPQPKDTVLGLDCCEKAHVDRVASLAPDGRAIVYAVELLL